MGWAANGHLCHIFSRFPFSLGIRMLPQATTRTSVTTLLPLRPLPSFSLPSKPAGWSSPHSRGVSILTRPVVRKSVPCEAGLGSWPSYRNFGGQALCSADPFSPGCKDTLLVHWKWPAQGTSPQVWASYMFQEM